MTKARKPASDHPWRKCVTEFGSAKDKRKKELVAKLKLMKQQMKKIN
jgi:hypothetical protein